MAFLNLNKNIKKKIKLSSKINKIIVKNTFSTFDAQTGTWVKSIENTENVAPITQPIQSAEESGIRCSECLVFHFQQSIESQLVWKTCYDCDKWLCGVCVTENLEFALNSQHTTDEFCCSDCLCKL